MFLKQNIARYPLLSDKLLVKHNKDVFFIDIDDIIFIEKICKTTVVHMKDKKYKNFSTLSCYEKYLSQYFCRVHRSYIVNLKKIDKIISYSDSSNAIYFNNYNEIALLSKERYKHFLDILMSYSYQDGILS